MNKEEKENDIEPVIDALDDLFKMLDQIGIKVIIIDENTKFPERKEDERQR